MTGVDAVRNGLPEPRRTAGWNEDMEGSVAEHLLIGLASVVILGIASQWLAWRLQLPSILLLLLAGFLAGPVTGFLNADDLLGDLLFPLVSISVALILFEGGLTLRISEYLEVRRAVRNLVTVGALVTWVIAGAAAALILGLDLPLAILLGAILVVTGPTVIGPLLRHVRPHPRVGSVAKWEGIMIDPIGATLAVLVFEAILAGGIQEATGLAVVGFLSTLVVGVAIGVIGAALMVVLLRRYWIPDFLQNPVTLMFVVAVFAASNLLVEESGLLTVTVMGLVLANQRWVAVRHIIEFKENLRVLLISSLFILLASRLELAQLTKLDLKSVAFVLVLVFLARPAAVFLSTHRSRLSWKEQVFLCWMAPRGIVAAAVASIFSLRLVDLGYRQAEQLVALTFLIIVVTVALYGLTAKRLAIWLGLSQPHPQGFLLVGSHTWARQIGKVLVSEGISVIVVDTNRTNIGLARMDGLNTYYGSILSEYAHHEMQLEGIGRLLALTANDEANALACLQWTEVFGRAEVFQLPPEKLTEHKGKEAPKHLMGRQLFSEEATYQYMTSFSESGGIVKATKLTEEFGLQDLAQVYPGGVLPLFALAQDRGIEVFTTNWSPDLRPGDTLICLVKE
jgi:NhaP-type Na+/H+ or K+/H+ antiporter